MLHKENKNHNKANITSPLNFTMLIQSYSGFCLSRLTSGNRPRCQQLKQRQEEEENRKGTNFKI